MGITRRREAATGTFYSPTAAAVAQNNAAVQNDAMVAATVESGQRNMAVLEQSVIKDNTLMPGEWYGGQLHLAPPTDQADEQKSYTIVITVGSDRHVIDVTQGPPAGHDKTLLHGRDFHPDDPKAAFRGPVEIATRPRSASLYIEPTGTRSVPGS
jgi:hypothetical protein